MVRGSFLFRIVELARRAAFLSAVAAVLGVASPVVSAEGDLADAQRLDAVRERAAVYLEAVRTNDLKTAYDLELAAAEGKMTAAHYARAVAGRNSRLIAYEIRDVVFSGEDRAVVTVAVTEDLAVLKTPYRSTRQMVWTFHEGLPYHGEARADDAAEQRSARE